MTLDQALRLAERLGLEELFVHALTSRAISVVHEGRFVESRIDRGPECQNLACP